MCQQLGLQKMTCQRLCCKAVCTVCACDPECDSTELVRRNHQGLHQLVQTLFYSTKRGQYAIIAAREWLDLIALIYFCMDTISTRVNAVYIDVGLVQCIRYLVFPVETIL